MGVTMGQRTMNYGPAGFVTNELENIIQKCHLDKEYKETQINDLSSRISSDGEAFTTINEDLLNNKLGTIPQENVQHRLTSSAKTLLQHFEANIAACKEKNLSADFLKALSNTEVQRPNFLNAVTDILRATGLSGNKEQTQQSRQNLIGVYYTQNSMAVYRSKMPGGAEYEALKTSETLNLMQS